MAVTVAVWSAVIDKVLAPKVPVSDPAAMVTDAGTVRPLLLERDMLNPPAGAAALIVTVQVEDPLLCSEEGLQETDTGL